MIIVFIRQKTIYNRPYAYLVSTRWDKRSKKVKQKVSKYLGKIMNLERVRDLPFLEYFASIDDIEEYTRRNSMEDIIKDLVELELYRHGYLRREGDGRVMVNGEHEIDIEGLDNLKGVFSLNEGFLAKETIRGIRDYDKIFKKAEDRYPFDFAALFVNAGINIDKELFISLYRRCFPDFSENRHSA